MGGWVLDKRDGVLERSFPCLLRRYPSGPLFGQASLVFWFALCIVLLTWEDTVGCSALLTDLLVGEPRGRGCLNGLPCWLLELSSTEVRSVAVAMACRAVVHGKIGFRFHSGCVSVIC